MKIDGTVPGIEPDAREGSTLRTSATTGPERDLEQAVTAALTSLLRIADDRGVELDATTVTTRTKVMWDRAGNATATLIIATGVAYA